MPKICQEPWNGPMFSPKGEIFPCCYIYEARRNEETPRTWEEWYFNHKITVPQHQYMFGNISENKIEDIWKGFKYQKLREHVNFLNSIDRFTTPDLFLKIRKAIDVSKEFNYCRICLWRWNQSC